MECFFGSVFSKDLFNREGADNEFLIINVTWAIDVNVLYQIVNLFLIKVDATNLPEALNELISGQLAITVDVKSLKLICQIIQLSLAE